jgi:hypothetical protein
MQIDTNLDGNDTHQLPHHNLQQQQQPPWSPASFVLDNIDLDITGPEQWMHGSQNALHDSPMSAVDDMAAFLLPTIYGQDQSSLGSILGNLESVDATQTAIQLGPPTPTGQSEGNDETPELQKCLDEMSPNIKHLVEVYFAKVHSYWPILHAPTFNTDKASRVLLGSMLVLARLVEGESGHASLGTAVFETFMTLQMVCK